MGHVTKVWDLGDNRFQEGMLIGASTWGTFVKSFGSEGKVACKFVEWDESGQREDYIVGTELKAWCWRLPA